MKKKYYKDFIDIIDYPIDSNKLSKISNRPHYRILNEIRSIIKDGNHHMFEYGKYKSDITNKTYDKFSISKEGLILMENILSNSRRKYLVGDKFKTKEGYDVEIIEYCDSEHVKIKFLDRYKYTTKVQTGHLVRGVLKNPYHKTKYNRFFLGECDKNSRYYLKAKEVWSSMIHRIFNRKYLNKRPTYKNHSICEEWDNFSNFQKWFEENYVEGWELDKDLKQLFKKNKIYSPETCVFIPKKLNIFITSMVENINERGVGISKTKNNKWKAESYEFLKGKKYLGVFKSKKMAEKKIMEFKNQQKIEIVKYIKNLNLKDESIIDIFCDIIE